MNHKADIINGYLRELKIAYKVMAGHPDVLNEFIKKVKSDGKSDSSTYQKNQIEPQGQHY